LFRQKKIIKNFFSLSTAEIVNRIVGLFYLPYIARIFGPEGFGKVNFAESIIVYFMLTANFGFDFIGIREVAKYKEDQGKAFVHILAIELITSIFSFLALCVFVYFITQSFEIKLLIILYGFTLITFGFTIDWFFIGLERMGTVALVRIVKQLCYIGLILLTIHSPQHLYRLPLSYVAADILAVVIFFYLFFLKNKKPYFKIEFSAIRYLCIETVPLGMSNFLNTSRERTGPVFLGFLKSVSEVGFYSVGYKLMSVANIIPYTLYRAIFPDMAYYLKNRSYEEARSYIKEIYKVVSLLALPLSFFIYYNAPIIVRLIFGTNFQNGIIILRIMIWCTAILLFNRLYYVYMISMSWQRRLFVCTSISLCVNIVLCLYFVKLWGAVGATWAFLISELFLGFIYYFASGIKVAPGREILMASLYFLPSLFLCIFLDGKVNSLLVSLYAMIIYAAIIFKSVDLKSLLKIHAQEPEKFEEISSF